VMELTAEGLADDEEKRAKGGAVWMVLARGLADWEQRKKAEKAASSHPNRQISLPRRANLKGLLKNKAIFVISIPSSTANSTS